MSDDLEPLSPKEGIGMDFEARRDELSERTIQSQQYRLDAFQQ